MPAGEPNKSSRTPLLVIVGVLLVALVVGGLLRLAQGNDSDTRPSPEDLPDGVVAVVAGAPESLETVTRPALDRALAQAAASAKVEPIPEPGDERYSELQETALRELLEAIWILGQGEEMGIDVSAAEISTEREKLTQESFKTDAQYREFLDESHLSEADVDKRVKTQIASEAIQRRISDGAAAPSAEEIERYYATNKGTQFDDPTNGTESLSAVRSQIKSQLEEQKTQEAFTVFVKRYQAQWRSRTVCAPAFAIENCSNGKRSEIAQDNGAGEAGGISGPE